MGLSSEVWFPVVTLVVGALLTFINDRVNSSRASKAAEGQRKSDQLRSVFVEQRALLIELREETTKFARSLTLCFLEDDKNHRATGEWGKQKLGHDLDIALFEDARRLSFLVERVLREDLRVALSSMSSFYSQFALEKDADSAWVRMQDFSNQMQNVQAKLGEGIRELDIVSFASVEDIRQKLGVRE